MIFVISRRLLRFIIAVVVLLMLFFALDSLKWGLKIIYPIHYKDLVQKYAQTHQVDPFLVAAIIRNESKFNPNAVSRKEAKGLMQIAPITGQWASERLNISDYSEDKLFEPDMNINIGCWYLSVLYKEYNNNLPLVIAAYNAGNGNVSRWLENPEYSSDGKSLKKIPFEETRIYSIKVMRDYKIYKKIYQSQT